MQIYFAVMLGGAIGSALRLWVSLFFASRHGGAFPLGTLVVNVAGCLAIGLFAGLTGPQGMIVASPAVRSFVTIGVLGGFTTFSSFGLQTLELMTEGDFGSAMLNVGLSVLLCLLAVWIGMMSAHAINRLT